MSNEIRTLSLHHTTLARMMGEDDGVRRASGIPAIDVRDTLSEMEWGNVPYPLSGEWAAEMTINVLAAEILGEHWDGWPSEDIDTLCDEYEKGFFAAYLAHLESRLARMDAETIPPRS